MFPEQVQALHGDAFEPFQACPLAAKNRLEKAVRANLNPVAGL